MGRQAHHERRSGSCVLRSMDAERSNMSEEQKELTEQEKYDLLTAWDNVKREIVAFKPTIEKEAALRKRVMAAFFPSPKEGVNTVDLQADWKLKGTHKLDRKIDEAALPAVQEQMRDAGYNPDVYIKHVPELNVMIYKAASPEVKKIFDHAIIMKPASPTVELVPPKEKKS